VKKPTIVISMGDPSGIGAEVILKALASPEVKRLANYLVVGDESVLKRNLSATSIRKNSLEFYLLDLGNVRKKGFKFASMRGAYGRASAEYIETAIDIIKAGAADALVTAPINKESLSKAGYKWAGHTEFLKHLTGAKDVAMMLTGGPLKVVLVTRHIALKNVAKSLKTKDIFDTLKLTNTWFRQNLKVKKPKIAVCALNPHCGEGGAFGNEEKAIISPAVKKARKISRHIHGPFACDSVFFQAYKGSFDAVVCMYHDQGLIPLKMIAKDSGVNITLGLPIIRTSPAHGTAFDIAGRGAADPGSMIEAIKTAVRLCR